METNTETVMKINGGSKPVDINQIHEQSGRGPSFKPWGIRAIKDRLKTQTRRVCPEPRPGARVAGTQYVGDTLYVCELHRGEEHPTIPAPYQPGTWLHLREPTEKCVRDFERGPYAGHHEEMAYSADKKPVVGLDGEPVDWKKANGEPYIPDRLAGIFMRKCAARLYVQFDVRVERLTDITPEDAHAEGVWYWAKAHNLEDTFEYGRRDKRRAWAMFPRMWNWINPDDPWESEPLVWVLSLRKLVIREAV